jgi:hypothetical protein
MRTVLIEYTLQASAEVADVERHIQDFVAGIAHLGVGIGYTSHRRAVGAGGPRSYAHLARIPTEAAQATLTAQPFFGAFTEYLRSVAVEPPKVSTLEVVATTG